MKCYYHPEVDAVAACTNCGKAICQADSVNVSGRIVCQKCLAVGPIAAGPIVAARPTNPMAIVSLAVGVLGLLGCLCGGGIGGLVFGVPAALIGYLARQQLAQPNANQEGLQLATIGMGLGLAEVGLSVAVLVLIGGTVGLGTFLSWLQQAR